LRELLEILEAEGACNWASARSGGVDDRRQDMTDACRGSIGIRLAGVEPRDDRLDRDRGRQVTGPPGPDRILYEITDLAMCDGHRSRTQIVYLGPELRLARGVVEQEPKTIRILN
jgi:hypothetical protein